MSFMLPLVLMPNSVLLFLHFTSVLSLLACPVLLKVIVPIGATVNHIFSVANWCQGLCPLLFGFQSGDRTQLSSAPLPLVSGEVAVKSNQIRHFNSTNSQQYLPCDTCIVGLGYTL